MSEHKTGNSNWSKEQKAFYWNKRAHPFKITGGRLFHSHVDWPRKDVSIKALKKNTRRARRLRMEQAI